ncbi:type 1 fimbrial protein [Providencia sp. JGM181]|uniref:fimbrial protein n=1 Tax=unclassified Providencia TaxID=2633465 RepID=UPI001BAE1AC6|nr:MULTISPECIES: fimbrial protein [unclassified Providencia]MBS0925956.1 type 1 fimbrial protein [Providencia sp. JGM181]MBS0934144.1 type 1 fimbrial protein [Providencia sp. JGM172]MBS0998173.1 type 1 fimbrial protein [Providencia sp. JGM178]
MKRILFSLLGLYALPVMAENVNIYVHGNVVVMPCKVENTSYNVELGKINRWNYRNPAQSPWVDFSIKLVDCPVSTKNAKFSVNGTADATDNNYFVNTGSSTNSLLHLAQRSNKATIKNGSTVDITINSTTKSAEIPLSARMVSFESMFTPGDFKSHLEFSLAYP